MAALLGLPPREQRDTSWTRAGRGGLLAPTPRLCYPSLHPGSAALLTTRAPAGGRDRPPASPPHAPLGGKTAAVLARRRAAAARRRPAPAPSNRRTMTTHERFPLMATLRTRMSVPASLRPPSRPR